MAKLVVKQFVSEDDPLAFPSLSSTHHQPAGVGSNQLPPANASVDRVEFGLLSASDATRMSHVKVVSKNLYDMTSRTPVNHGVLDPNLGTNNKRKECRTCRRRLEECIGHFGHITLQVPSFHIGYFKDCQRVLHAICKNCSRVILNQEKRASFMRTMLSPRYDIRFKDMFHRKIIIEECKRTRECPYCGALNGVVKKVTGAFRLIHDFKKSSKVAEEKREFWSQYDQATAANPVLGDFVKKAMRDMDASTVLQLFRAIPNIDLPLLNMSPSRGRPEDMLFTQMVVPPVCIRPTVDVGAAGTQEDDLTIKLKDIVYINHAIQDCVEKGGPPTTLFDNWEFLQAQIAMYINSDMPGFQQQTTFGRNKPLRALTQRLKGKQGRFRQNLSGKRVDFSARTVISPDANLRVDQVGVPMYVARKLTYPERVTIHNIDMLRQCVRNGPNKWPGAVTLHQRDGKKFMIRPGRKDLSSFVKVGDIVERHMRDEDIVLFNRQPSLHKLSIMSHRVKVMPWRTFRFNECVCTPYNADFDGDEMNMHLPQTYEARAEASELMSVIHNMVTPRLGHPLITATQDFLSAAFLITRRDVFYDRAQFCNICCYMGDALERVDIPPPTIFKPIQLWTGKQVFDVLLRPSKDPLWPIVTMENRAKNYVNSQCMCPQDGYVIIRNSRLLCGNLDKATLGGSQKGLFYVLIREHSPHAAGRALNRLAKLCARWIGEKGFSIGIGDVTPSAGLNQRKEKLLQQGYSTCSDLIQQWKDGKLQPQPGLSVEATLEAKLLGELSQIRQETGSYCLQELDYHHNAPLIMAMCGSKGSPINISQMVACVGQQAVSGKRIANGFESRTLPHFPRNSLEPEAKGFCANSFFSGLKATEFFFHTMGGREGLVDTSVKTSQTGYLQRRLMKALEDLCVNYDDTVRSADKGVVQFIYGDDGLDPVMMVKGPKPVHLERTLEHVRVVCPAPRCRELAPAEFEELYLRLIVKHLQEHPKGDGTTDMGSRFVADLQRFLQVEAITLRKARTSLGIPQDMNVCIPFDSIDDSSDASDAENPPPSSPMRAACVVLRQTHHFAQPQLELFLRLAFLRYLRSKAEPGSAVGAVAAQSIGEPVTQMTLKTFHFAGVASMNVTLGVPRMNEIVNATQSIHTPLLHVPLVTDNNIQAARIVKGRIEMTTLGEVCSSLKEVYSHGQCYLSIELSEDVIQALQLDVDALAVEDALLTSKLKLRDKVMVMGKYELRVYPPKNSREEMLYSMGNLMRQLPDVVVCGINGVTRAVIHIPEDAKEDQEQYELLVEHTNVRTMDRLMHIMTTVGVRGREVTSNHIIEVERTLGIEAARATIVKEINHTMGQHGLSIDSRHVALLADVMTYKGVVLSVTRHGIRRMKHSILDLASFETATDHLFHGAVHGSTDEISGVAERIIMGLPIPVGTGLFEMVQRRNVEPVLHPRQPTLL